MRPTSTCLQHVSMRTAGKLIPNSSRRYIPQNRCFHYPAVWKPAVVEGYTVYVSIVSVGSGGLSSFFGLRSVATTSAAAAPKANTAAAFRPSNAETSLPGGVEYNAYRRTSRPGSAARQTSEPGAPRELLSEKRGEMRGSVVDGLGVIWCD